MPNDGFVLAVRVQGNTNQALKPGHYLQQSHRRSAGEPGKDLLIASEALLVLVRAGAHANTCDGYVQVHQPGTSCEQISTYM
jgi:hypothetical protein